MRWVSDAKQSTSKAPTTFSRFVEVGRVVLLQRGADDGKLAVIVEIVDHSRVLIDGTPNGVGRQSIALRHVILTPLVISKLPRGIGQKALAKAWEKAGVQDKWTNSSWAKKRANVQRRRNLSDFERFQVTALRKQRRIGVSRELTKSAPKKKAAA